MDQGLKWRIGFWGLVCFMLLIPLLAMQVTDAVNWAPGDFLAAALLLGGGGLALELATKVLLAPSYRCLAAAGVVLVIALIWAELAVGIFH